MCWEIALVPAILYIAEHHPSSAGAIRIGRPTTQHRAVFKTTEDGCGAIIHNIFFNYIYTFH